MLKIAIIVLVLVMLECSDSSARPNLPRKNGKQASHGRSQKNGVGFKGKVSKVRGREDSQRYGAHDSKISESGASQRKGRYVEPGSHPSVELSGLKQALQASLKGQKNSASPKTDEYATGAEPDSSFEDDAGAKDDKQNNKDRHGRKLRPGSFAALGLSEPVVKGMTQAGYRFPTPVQRKVIPPAISGFDIVAMARTGSGKTAAFIAPMVTRISEMAASPSQEPAAKLVSGLRGLVMVPTRELALQTFQFFKKYARFTSLTACLIAGGESLESQFSALATNPEIAIATPGRLLQLLSEISTLTLQCVQVCVLDEADRLFEGNLKGVVLEILSRLDGPKNRPAPSEKDERKVRQMVLLSATLPRALADFASKKLSHDHVVVRLDTDKFLSPTLRIGFYYVTTHAKMAGLLFLIKDIVGGAGELTAEQRHMHDAKLLGEGVHTRGLFPTRQGTSDKKKEDTRNRNNHIKRCLVFCATRHSVELLTQVLALADVSVGGIHGNMDQEHRKIELGKFKDRRTSVLVVTDVAARGLDIPLLDYVVNYDFPATPKLFVHRCGRAGRAGIVGTAHSLVTPGDIPHYVDASVFLGRTIEYEPRNGSWSNTVLEGPDNFLFGTLPASRISVYTRVVYRIFQRDGGLTSQAATARRGYDLYVRTCPKASGNSYDKAKAMLAAREPGSVVHAWFRSLAGDEEGGMNEEDEEVKQMRQRLARWEPRNSSELGLNWQKDLWKVCIYMYVCMWSFVLFPRILVFLGNELL
jgi:ATP-dependent RNA helicase DDX54/DBP10